MAHLTAPSVKKLQAVNWCWGYALSSPSPRTLVRRSPPSGEGGCGERVGVRGCLREFERCECAVSPPSPGSLRDPTSPRKRGEVRKGPYAVAISGKTASILVFRVAALNG